MTANSRPRVIDFESLRYFVEVVRQKNITKAAAILNIAQPAITRRIHSVEESLGLALLTRHQRGVRTTEAGTVLFERAEYLLRLVDDLPQTVLSHAAEPAGQIRLGFPPALGNVFVFNIVSELLGRHSRVSFSLHELFSQAVREGLIAGRLDVGIMRCEQGHPDLHQVPLFGERIWLVGRATEWPFEGSNALTARQLVGKPLLMSSSLRPMLEQFARAEGVQFDIRLQADAIMSLKEGVRRGTGFLVGVPSACSQELSTGEFVGLPLRRLKVTRGLFWRNDRPPTRALLELFMAIEAEAASLRTRSPSIFESIPRRRSECGRDQTSENSTPSPKKRRHQNRRDY